MFVPLCINMLIIYIVNVSIAISNKNYHSAAGWGCAALLILIYMIYQAMQYSYNVGR